MSPHAATQRALERAAHGGADLGRDRRQLGLVGLDGAAQQREVVARTARRCRSGPGCPWEGTSPPPRARAQVVEADAVVVGHAEQTSRTSAPTASHRLDTAFTKLSLVARKALDAYLMVSAVAASVTIAVPGSTRTAPPPGPPRPGRRRPPRSGRGAGRRGWPCPRAGTRGSTPRPRRGDRGAVRRGGWSPPGPWTCSPRWRRARGAARSRGHGFEVAHVGGPVGALGRGDAQEHEVGAAHGLGGPEHEA